MNGSPLIVLWRYLPSLGAEMARFLHDLETELQEAKTEPASAESTNRVDEILILAAYLATTGPGRQAGASWERHSPEGFRSIIYSLYP